MQAPEGQVAQGGWADLTVRSCQAEGSLSSPPSSWLNQFLTAAAAVVSYRIRHLTGLHPVRCLLKFTMKQKIESLHLGHCASTFFIKQLYLSHVPAYFFWRIWKKGEERPLWQRTRSRLARFACALWPHCLFLAEWTCWRYSLTFLSSCVESGKCV